MLSCRDVTGLVTDFTEGRLSFMDGVRFRLHLSMCGNCRRYVAQMRAMVAVSPHVQPPAPSDDVVESLSRFFAKRPPAPPRARSGGLFVVGVITLIAAAYGFFVGHAGPVGSVVPCLGGELAMGAGAVAIWSRNGGRGADPIAWAGAAAVGAAAAFLGLAVMCPADETTLHMLVAHTGGIALAAVVLGGLRATLLRPA